MTFRIYPTKTVLHVSSQIQVGGALPQAFDCPSTEEHLGFATTLEYITYSD